MQKKTFAKIHHLFYDKNSLNKFSIEGTHFNIIKEVYYMLTVNIILNVEKLKAFPLRSGTRLSMPTLTTFIQYSTGNPNQTS